MSQSEAARLAALQSYDVLDTSPEAAFDRLTALAADLFDVPVALVSLVDAERQWFKSRHGLDATETPRAWAFCDHTIRLPADDCLVVEDATQDERFKANPLVTGNPDIRFYAGAPLTTRDGHNLGSLCVIDMKSRLRPSDRDLARLNSLARIVVDELDLRRTAQRVARQKHHLELAEAMSRVGTWSYRLSDGKMQWSDEVYRIYGVTRETFDPNLSDGLEFFHPEDRPKVQHLLASAILHKSGYEFQLRIVRDDGEVREVSAKARCELDEKDQVTSVVGVFQDITESVRTLRRAQRSETRYKLLADNMGDIITHTHFDGRAAYVSPGIETLLGLTRAEMAGRSGIDFIHPDDRQMVTETLAELRGGQSTRTIQYRLVHREGHAIWVEVNYRLVRDIDGTPKDMVAVIRDISKRRAVEAALAESEARHRHLADTAPDIITEAQLDGTLTYVSPAALAVTGFTAEELTGRTAFSLMSDEDADALRNMCATVIVSKGRVQPTPIEFRATHKDGHEIWLESKPMPFRDAKGRITGLTDVLRDITRHKALEAELLDARREAEAAAAVKAEFLANMSHELRTPLTAVLGFAKLVADQPELATDTRTYVERLNTAGRMLLATVNDILDFSKLEAGQVEIRNVPTAPAALLNETVEMLGQMAREKGVGLALAADTLPAFVQLDPDRMRQILLNLVGNAVKFTEKGEVRIEARYGTASGELAIRVVDTGPGIPADRIGALFQRFSQIDGSSTRRHGGTGLGLAICNGLVSAMGGRIGAESKIGVGSTFWVTLPAPKVGQLRSPAVAAPLGMTTVVPGCRVLVADNNVLNRKLVRAYLQPLKVELTEAENGAEAVAEAAKMPFDVILMDLRMPVLDGRGAAAQIRDGNGPNAATPILAFSADSFPIVQDGLFDAIVSKPIVASALTQAIARAIDGEMESVRHAAG